MCAIGKRRGKMNKILNEQEQAQDKSVGDEPLRKNGFADAVPCR